MQQGGPINFQRYLWGDMPSFIELNDWAPSECVCIRVCECVCACVSAYVYVSVYVCARENVCVCKCTYAFLCIRVWICAYMCACVSVYLLVKASLGGHVTGQPLPGTLHLSPQEEIVNGPATW